MAPPPELLGLPSTLGRYQLVRLLGQGGMGRVVLGHDPVLRRDVALKLVEPLAVDPEDLPELRFMFHREARATAALRHPNIIEVLDYSGPDAEVLYLACELVVAPTLRDVLDVHGRLPAAHAAACTYELAAALAHAHEGGIVHRDLKPENVFWTSAGRIVMSDFGIAKAFAGTTVLGGTVQFGATNVYGSPAYMAPEQLQDQGAAPAGPKSDIFALGALFYELLFGQPAFDGDSLQALLDAVRAGKPAPTPVGVQVPDLLQKLCLQMLARRPDERPSAKQVGEQLRASLDVLGVSDPRLTLASFGNTQASPLPPKVDGAPLRSRRPGVLLLSLALAAALLAVVAAAAVVYTHTEAGASLPTGKISVRLRPRQAALLRVDGDTVGRIDGEQAIELLPGRHRVELQTAAGTVTREIMVLAGTAPVFEL